MEKIPSQEQIRALRQEARRSVSAVQLSDQTPSAAAFDLRESKALSESEKRAIAQLQESFARKASESLSSYLRGSFELKLAGMESKTLADLTAALTDPLYLASINLSSPDAQIFLYLDLPLVFQIVDLMLGGDGKEPAPERDLTPIEEEIFESAGRVLCEELRLAWQPALRAEIQFDERQKLTHLSSTLPVFERLLLARFDVVLGENQGTLTLVLPGAVTTALTRTAAVPVLHAEPKGSQKGRERLRQLVAESVFEAELTLPASPVSVREIFALKAGSVVVLNVRASEPIHLNVAGKNMFTAVPVGCGLQRGAQIEKVLSIAQSGERKSS